VRYELNLYMLLEESRPPLLSEFLAAERRCIVFPVTYELNFVHNI
jgi:hypothetical protein